LICQQTMQQLVKNMVNKGRSVPKDLNKLLGHMIKLSKEVFTCCDVKTTHQVGILITELARLSFNVFYALFVLYSTVNI